MQISSKSKKKKIMNFSLVIVNLSHVLTEGVVCFIWIILANNHDTIPFQLELPYELLPLKI